MPWNFPLWQAMRFAAPALAAGNVGLLKHASNVPQTALFMEELFRDAGFPDDVFQTLLIGSGKVEAVLKDDRGAAATLTGSEGAGVAVGRTAGRVAEEGRARARRLRRLRGDADRRPRPAAKVATHARCQNNGQSCIAAKRFIVHADVYDECLALFTKRDGRPGGRRPDGGGHRRRAARHRAGPRDVEELVKDAVDKGATWTSAASA